MSYDYEQDIREFFENNWNSTEIAWPDYHFNKPSSTWVSFTYKENAGYQASMGSPGTNRFRTLGMVTIQVFALSGDASIDAREKAGLLKDLFRSGVTSGNVNFYDVTQQTIGVKNGWYQINVKAYFKHDEIT
ncbi:MAG: phage tail terminator-like protein [Alphaproteobacteria bacterium]